MRYEKHNDPLTTDQLDKLEDHGFDIAYILWGKQEIIQNELSEEEKQLIEFYRCTRSEMRTALISLVKTYAEQFNTK